MASAAMRFASMMAELDDDDDVAPKAAESRQPSDNPQPAAADASSPQQPAETAASMVERHRLEMAEVEEKCRSKLSESKKKNKIVREQAQAECEEMKRAIVTRHEQELTSLPSTELAIARQLASISLNEETVESNKSGFAYSAAEGKKKGKQQKKKEARAEQEEKRYQEAKAAMKDWVDPKEVEEKQLQAKLDKLGMRVHPVDSDGHCMYRALLDQLALRIDDAPPALAARLASGGASHADLRRAAADYMRRCPDDFAPFVADDDGGGGGGGGGFEAYLARVAETAEWGGNLELVALARALPARITVVSAAADDVVVEPDRPAALSLFLSYHRHAFGLGEHYNSLRPV